MWAEQLDASFKLPHRIVDDKVGDMSIKLQSFGGQENWTAALKFMLSDLKALVSVVGRLANEGKC